MNDTAHLINGDLLRQRRETKGWAQTDLATRACLSLKQVRQIEGGGNSAFYSDSVKATAARKLATLLGLAPEQAFVSSAIDAAPLSALPDTDGGGSPSTETSPAMATGLGPHGEADRASAAQHGADLSSVMTHVAVATADIDPPPPQSLSAGGADGESRSNSFLWVALLAVAVGAGVLLMPKTPDAPAAPAASVPTDPNPPAPPPLELTADAVDASGNPATPAQVPVSVAPGPAVVTPTAPAPMGQAAPAPVAVPMAPAAVNPAPKAP